MSLDVLIQEAQVIAFSPTSLQVPDATSLAQFESLRTSLSNIDQFLRATVNYATHPESENVHFTFFEWLKSHDCKGLENVRIAMMNDRGNGLLAEKPLKQGEWVFTIHDSCIISSRLVAESAIGLFFENDPIAQAMKAVPMALYLLEAKRQGASHAFAPYLNVLPKKIELPMFFSGISLAPLLNTVVLQNILKLFKHTVRQYLHILTLLLRKDKTLLVQQELPLWEEWQWAIGVCLTRQNPDMNPGDVALIPLYDMMNHTNETTEITTLGDRLNGQIETFACLSFEKDQEIVMSYAKERDHYDTFVYGGYLLENTANEIATARFIFPTVQVSSTDKVSQLRQALLEVMQLTNIGIYRSDQVDTESPCEAIVLSRIHQAGQHELGTALQYKTAPRAQVTKKRALVYLRARVALLHRQMRDSRIRTMDQNSQHSALIERFREREVAILDRIDQQLASLIAVS